MNKAKQDQRKIIRDREIANLATRGASVYQILNQVRGATFIEAETIIKRVAEDLKKSGPAHRLALRNSIRETGALALSVLSSMAQDDELKPELRLRAAETLLRHAADMSDESVLRSWQERPDESEKIQPTIFDFGPVIEVTGEIGFRGESRLAVVPDENLTIDLDESEND